jgi:hypothetical protein
VALIETVGRRDRDEARWAEVLTDLGQRASAATAADGLDRLLARGRLSAGSRARLLIADGDRLRAAHFKDRAASRYAQVIDLVPDSVEAGRARVRTMRLAVSRVRTMAELDTASWQLNRVITGMGGAALADAKDLQQELTATRGGGTDSSDVEDFRAAELARDTWAAPALAATLFLRFAERHPTSLFAPKALIAAAHLRPEALDSIGALLRQRFPESPYTVAFRGESSPAFQVIEDSLALALGVSRLTTRVRSRSWIPPGSWS